jgi:predicted metal-dependent hydrolase
MNDLKTADIKINSLIRSSRKTLTLIVKPDASLVVRAPLFTSMRRIMDFVNKNQAWIKKRQDKIKSQPVIERLTPEVLEPKILRQYKKG